MKTIYKLLGWVFGISAFSVIVSGIIGPLYSEGMIPAEATFRFLLFFIPLLLASVFFHKKANRLDWDNDLFYLFSKLILKNSKALKSRIDKKADETKDKIRDDLSNN
jgi:hypothetical protein